MKAEMSGCEVEAWRKEKEKGLGKGKVEEVEEGVW